MFQAMKERMVVRRLARLESRIRHLQWFCDRSLTLTVKGYNAEGGEKRRGWLRKHPEIFVTVKVMALLYLFRAVKSYF